PEVDAVENRAGVDPRIACLRPAIGITVAEERLTQARNELRRARRRIRRRARGAQRAHYELERRLDLCLVRFAREELARREDGAQRLADVAVRMHERYGRTVHERRWRGITHEAAYELRGNEVRRRGAMRQDVEHLLAVLDAAARPEGVAQEHLHAGIVHGGTKDEGAALVGSVNAPAGEGTCRRDDVALRVAAVHANGVELHELAAVIFVETPGTGGSSLRLPGGGACGSALREPASGTGARRLRKSGT